MRGLPGHMRFNFATSILSVFVIRCAEGHSSSLNHLPQETICKIAISENASVLALLAQTNRYFRSLCSKLAYDGFIHNTHEPQTVFDRYIFPSIAHFCLANPSPTQIKTFANMIFMASSELNMGLISHFMDRFKEISHLHPELLQTFKDQIFHLNESNYNCAIDEDDFCIGSCSQLDPLKFYFPLLKLEIRPIKKMFSEAALYSLTHVFQRKLKYSCIIPTHERFIQKSKIIIEYFGDAIKEELGYCMLLHADALKLIDPLISDAEHDVERRTIVVGAKNGSELTHDVGTFAEAYEKFYGLTLPCVTQEEIIIRINEGGEIYVGELLAVVSSLDQVAFFDVKPLLERLKNKNSWLSFDLVTSKFFHDLFEPETVVNIEGVDYRILRGIKFILDDGSKAIKDAIKRKLWTCQNRKTFNFLSDRRYTVLLDGLKHLDDGQDRSFMGAFPDFMHDLVIQYREDIFDTTFIEQWIKYDIKKIIAYQDPKLIEAYRRSLQSDIFRLFFLDLLNNDHQIENLAQHFPDIKEWKTTRLADLHEWAKFI